jgi:hypothetical protein
MSPRWGSTPRLTDWPTVSLNVTLAWLWLQIFSTPRGGGFEYLHRSPASRRRRRKGKSQIWDSKILSRVWNDSDSRKTTLARASSIYKRQTRLLVREGAPRKPGHKSQSVINIWLWAPEGARHQDLTDWLTVSRNVTLTLTNRTEQNSREESSSRKRRTELLDVSLPGDKLGTELSWQLQNSGKKRIRQWKNTSYVNWSHSETDINPSPGYNKQDLIIIVPVQRWTAKRVNQR